ncbi:MAG: HEPN domain-containing protein [Candidatus Aenigmarchaeota archaeon]|nr:HEPN domain-containing protein [Candidatus Aenigmarchaeota archaeon]
MKAKDMIVKSMKRVKEERGLRVSKPNNQLSEGHIRKADHNLIVMTDLSRLGHEDWVVISAYYAMYQSAMSLLTKIGLESKDHATTAAVLEYFFGEQISKDLIGKFNELKERKDKIEAITISEKYIDYLWKIKRARETVQYGISINYKETDVVMRNAREFVSKMKLVLNELDEKLVEIIGKKAKELQILQ